MVGNQNDLLPVREELALGGGGAYQIFSHILYVSISDLGVLQVSMGIIYTSNYG